MIVFTSFFDCLYFLVVLASISILFLQECNFLKNSMFIRTRFTSVQRTVKVLQELKWKPEFFAAADSSHGIW